MHSRPWYLVATLVLLLATGPVQAQTINVDAVTRYWEITDGLRQNRPLTDQMWQEFLEIPGNKIYVRGIYSAADLVRYRKAIEVVYMPRYDSLRRAKLDAKVWYYMMVNDYKEGEPDYRQLAGFGEGRCGLARPHVPESLRVPAGQKPHQGGRFEYLLRSPGQRCYRAGRGHILQPAGSARCQRGGRRHPARARDAPPPAHRQRLRDHCARRPGADGNHVQHSERRLGRPD